MDRLTGGRTNCAHRECFRGWFGDAIKTLCFVLWKGNWIYSGLKVEKNILLWAKVELDQGSPQFPIPPRALGPPCTSCWRVAEHLWHGLDIIREKGEREPYEKGVYIPRLSSAFSTISNCWNHWISYCGSLMLSWIGVIRTFGLNGEAVWAATYSTMLNCKMDQGWGPQTYQSFTLLHILLFEQELPIEVWDVDGVQIEEGDFAKARQYDVFHWRYGLVASKSFTCERKPYVARSQSHQHLQATPSY